MLKFTTGLALVLAIASQSAARAESIDVVVEYTQEPIFGPAYRQIKQEFEQQNPDIRVVYRSPQVDYDAGIQTILRENLTGDLPDVAFAGLAQLRVAYDRKLAVDLAPLMQKEGSTFEAQGWNAGLQSATQVEATQIGLPFALSMPMVYFNADLVKQAGANPDAMPRDWNGMLALGSKIAALGNGTAGMYQSFTGLNGAWFFQGMVYGAGGEIMKAGADKVSFGGKEGLDALELYRRMAKEGGMPDIAESAARQQFLAGKIGLFLDSASRIANYQKTATGVFDLKTAPYPTPDGKPAGLVTGGSAGFVTVSAGKDAKKLDAAWKFLKFATGPKGTTAVIKNVGYTPVNTLALDDTKLLKGFFDDKPNYRTAVDQIPQLREWYQFPGENGAKINNVISEHIEAVVNGSAAPDAALAAMVSEVNGLLPRK